MNIINRRMSVREWIKVKGCPIQRNTEDRAKKAKRGHLKEYSDTHARVAAARMPDGILYKLDGHTRALLWAENSLRQPQFLQVDIYSVSSFAEMEVLYKQFDNAAATENSSDRVQGAFRKHGFVPVSNLVRKGGITTALATIVGDGRTVDVYEEINPWVPTLRLIDEANLSQGRINSPLLAACLLTVRRYGATALTFWEKYSQDGGLKEGKKRDAVQALSEMVDTRRAAGTLNGAPNIKDVCEKALSCYESYARNYWYTAGVKPTDMKDYKAKLGIFRNLDFGA